MIKSDWALTDFQRVLPASRISRDGRFGTWHAVAYRTADFSGVMIQANPDARAPGITIDLPLKGRYDLFVGMYKDLGDRCLLRLEGARCFERLAYSHPHGKGACFQDVHWRTVDLSGSDQLQIRQDGTIRAALGYILARRAGPPGSPGSPGPVPQPARPARPAATQYLLHVTDDGYPANWGFPLDHEDASWIVEPLARLGAGYVSRGCDIAGMANYHTRHASLRYGCDRALRLTSLDGGGTAGLKILRAFQRSRYSVPKRYYQAARQSGMEALGYCRMAHLSAPPPHHAHFSRLYDRRPEMRCVDISGAPVSRMSVAFPEVRREFLKLLAEQVEMGGAGVDDVFVRGLPMVLYERPVRERFRELHGGDITRLPENDPRARAVRAEFMTTFMREQRQALDRAAAAAGRAGGHATIMATVPSDRASCAFFGLDIQAWVREKLVDILCPYRFGFDASDQRKLDLDFFCRVVKGSGVLLLPHVRTWSDDLRAMLAHALEYTRWPIDGFSVWDANTIDPVARQAIAGLTTQRGIREAIAALKRGPKHRPILAVGDDGALLSKYGWGWNV